MFPGQLTFLPVSVKLNKLGSDRLAWNWIRFIAMAVTTGYMRTS